MREHELKTWPEPFEAALEGRKTYELRENDRGYAVGDTLWLREWDPFRQTYTGRSVRFAITYMTPGGAWGLNESLCVLALGPISRIPTPPRAGEPEVDRG